MAVSLATGANVTGSASGFVQAATVNYLQSLSAAKIKEIAPLLGGEGSTGHVALHALLGCAGAAAKSTGCGAAATGASAGIVISQLMEQVSGKSSNKLDPVKREARINLVTSVLAGLTAALDPKAVAAVNDAARVELENNQLALPLPVIGAGSAGGAFGSLGRRDSNGVASANENIARHLTRAWNRLFEKDSGPEEANGPLETPAVPPGGDTRVPGYAEDGRHAQGTPGYEADQGSLATPSYDADGNAYLGGSVTPMAEPQGPQVILNDATNRGSTSDILMPNGIPVGNVHPGAGPRIRTVTPEQFGALQAQLMSGASPVPTPPGYAGTWYQRADGTVFGIRNSVKSGATIDVVKSNNLSLPPGFKVHQR